MNRNSAYYHMYGLTTCYLNMLVKYKVTQFDGITIGALIEWKQFQSRKIHDGIGQCTK